MTTLVPNYGAPGYGLPLPPPPRLEGPLLPRPGELGWTIWPRRIWPIDPFAAAPRRLVIGATVAALLGTALWRPTVLSIGYLVVGLIVFGLVYGAGGRRPT